VVRRRRHEGGIQVIRGEVWLATLDPTIGTEIQKTRPCVILSPAEMNERLRTIIAVPMTSGSRPAPSRIPIHFQGRAGLILLEQIRALDKRRLVRRLGTISTAALNHALTTLREIFEE
jgi:mRNA interferase MazF